MSTGTMKMTLCMVEVLIFVLFLCESYAVSWRHRFLQYSQDLPDSFFCTFLQVRMNLEAKNQTEWNRIELLQKYQRDFCLNNVATNLNIPAKYVVVLPHNGLGNQLYQIVFGHLLAKSLDRQLLIFDYLPTYAYNPLHSSRLDPNSLTGYQVLRNTLTIPRINDEDYSRICQGSNLTFSERKSDRKFKHNHNRTTTLSGMFEIVQRNPICFTVLGYFHNYLFYSLYLNEVKSFLKRNFLKRELLGSVVSNVAAIHFRCTPRHYMQLPFEYYDTILRHLNISSVTVVGSRDCLDESEVVKSIETKYSITYGPGYYDSNVTNSIVQDFLTLATTTTLITGFSTFADWVGLLCSTCNSIHVPRINPSTRLKSKSRSLSNPRSPIWFTDSRFVYHDFQNNLYFGKYDNKSNSIIYMNREKSLQVG